MSAHLESIRRAAARFPGNSRETLLRNNSRQVCYSGPTTTEWEVEEIAYVLNRGRVLRESHRYVESLTVINGKAQPEHYYGHRDSVRELDDRDGEMFGAIGAALSRLMNR